VRFGRYEVHLFSAGTFKQDGGLMFGVVPRVVWERVLKPDERNRVTVPLNCLVVRDERHVFLFETGAGDKLEAKWVDIWGIDPRQHVRTKLAERGIGAEDVTMVVNTHLHFDHAGGNTVRDAGGEARATFPRARYVFQRIEWEDALHPHERSRASYFPDDFAPLEPVAEFVDGEAELLPGLRVVRVQGHTRATQYLLLQQEGRTLFFSCDFLMSRHHLPLPWIPALDLYPMDTLAAKKELLPRAVAEEWLVAFTHDLPRFGHVRRREGAYVFEELSAP
jgi:glyoxylase-like metal-dependent hydrolase (beta-lactamase superfamily II)